MYFSDKGIATPEGWKIEKANLLGENRQVVLSDRRGDGLGKPECLSYDYSTDTLYWVDTRDFVVKAYNFRDPVRTVVTGLTAGISWPGITNYQVGILHSIFTPRIPKDAGRWCFYTCLSVRRVGGYPKQVTWFWG